MKKSALVIIILVSGFLCGTMMFTSCSGKKAEQQEQKEAEDTNMKKVKITMWCMHAPCTLK